jgi:hypothetical protein
MLPALRQAVASVEAKDTGELLGMIAGGSAAEQIVGSCIGARRAGLPGRA